MRRYDIICRHTFFPMKESVDGRWVPICEVERVVADLRRDLESERAVTQRLTEELRAARQELELKCRPMYVARCKPGTPKTVVGVVASGDLVCLAPPPRPQTAFDARVRRRAAMRDKSTYSWANVVITVDGPIGVVCGIEWKGTR